MPDNQHTINEQLHRYKVRFIKKKLLEGVIVFVATALLVYLTVSSVEAVGRFNSGVRAMLLATFLLASGSVLFLRVIRPLFLLFRSDEAIGDEEAARQIGHYYPAVGDKLVNYIQLSAKPFSHNRLAAASLQQRARQLSRFSFPEAVSFAREKQYALRYIIPLLGLVLALVALFPASFIGSTQRIIHFDETFVPRAPFHFGLPQELIAFRNEDYLLRVSLSGEARPQEAWFVTGNKKTKMVYAGNGNFTLLFTNITGNKTFTIEAAGFHSVEKTLNVVDRPALSRFSVNLDYPAYLRLPDETLHNIGSFEVPEGTTVTWDIATRFTEKLGVLFADDSSTVKPENDSRFTFRRQILHDQSYELLLTNKFGQQQGAIQYEIAVIKDQAPEIAVKILPDTLLYRYVVFAGNLADDHGLRQLQLHYTKNGTTKGRLNLPLDKGATTQSLFYQWVLDSLQLAAGDELQFYLQVTDNDAINHYKTTKSKLFYLKVPDKQEALAALEEHKSATKKEITDAAEKARKLKHGIDKLVEDLKGKKELSWQEEQMLQNLIEEKEKLTEEIEKLQQENNLLNEQQKKFSPPNPETLQKQEQLQQLLDELLDEETKKLYDELQKLLESYEDTEPVQDLLQKIQNKELNLEQELARALEYFKQLQFAQKLDEARQQLDEIIEEQEALSEKTPDKGNPADSLAEEQGKLNEKFNDFQEKLREAKELNQALKRPNQMASTSGEEKEADEAQKEAKENLENNNRKKSKQSQQSATEKMKQVAGKISRMQQSMQMEQMQEDLGNLQAILSNLIELSFDQEQLMKDFRQVNQSDPAFISLSQEQLALKEDARIINDSLLALASRVMAISSFITRELNEMNRHMEGSITAIRERKKSEAAVSQQLTMTSANNLALMLDNVMRQMQENMAAAMGKGEQQGEEQRPGLSELQQKLNEQIRELGQSGKSGRELSEELAKLAAEQERIRKALEEAEKKYGGNEGETDKLMQQMEQTELDLVNKNINRQTLLRQQQILTRLLEAEKSMRERELDSQREAKSATQYEKILPKSFAEYIQQRQKEIELLKTVPPRLRPFYKREVSKYFNRVKQQTVNISN